MPISEEAAKRMIPEQRNWITKIVGACDPSFRTIGYSLDDAFGLLAPWHALSVDGQDAEI
jgi:hypothetical protein